MQLDTHGKQVAENAVEAEHLRRQAMYPQKITKRMRKQLRTQARLDKELTPTKAEAMSKGYNFIMTVLGRGCSVTTAQ